MKITFIDGSIKEYADGMIVMKLQKYFSIACKKAIFAKVNGENYDLDRPIRSDASLELITKDEKR